MYTDIDLRSALAMLASVRPGSIQYHDDSLLKHIASSPFRPEGAPTTSALVSPGGVVEALVVASWVPVRRNDGIEPGAILGSWYRLPVVHHPKGGSSVLEPFLDLPYDLISYDPTDSAVRAGFRGWSAQPATRAVLTGFLRGKYPSLSSFSHGYLGASNRGGIARGPAFWKWMFKESPWGGYRVYDSHVGVCVIGRDGHDVHIADLLCHQDSTVEMLTDFLGSILKYELSFPWARVIVESNQGIVLQSLWRLGFSGLDTRIMWWRGSAPSACIRTLADADMPRRRRPAK